MKNRDTNAMAVGLIFALAGGIIANSNAWIGVPIILFGIISYACGTGRLNG